IDHPNISRLYEFRATAKAHFIFAEIAAYGTLEEHLKAVRSSPGYTPALLENQVRAYIEQILMALVYCHELGVYQQQMKLSDVLLEDENTVKIASFGMCLLSFPRASKLLPHYTSPEGLHGQLHGGAPAEVWSLGVILFQLLTGRLPFDEPDEEALTNKIQWGYFKMRNSDQLSAPAEDLLRRMLDPDAKTRISLDAVISHEWI
ncbi:kinase-like protein, partial [Nadsonia fulvescens var. elongata DSM 6958]